MRKLIFTTVVCAFITAPAFADLYGTVSVSETGVGPNVHMAVHYSGALADGQTVYTGLYYLNLKNDYSGSAIPGGGEKMLVGDMDAFCIDIWDWGTSAYNTYEVRTLDQSPNYNTSSQGGPMGDAKARQLAELLDTYWDENLDTGKEYGAMQAAVWEIVAEDPTNGYDLDAGDFYLTGGSTNGSWARSQAETWLGSLSSQGHDHSMYVGLVHPTGTVGNQEWQDYVVRVPVPAAVLLGMLGLSVAGIKLRKHA